MASTYSALKVELITTGEQSGTWGTTTNTNLGTALEEAIVGLATANFASDADLTLTLTNSNATQIARHFVLNVTSGVSLSTTRNLIVPAIEKPYLIKNATTGGQSIVVKNSTGSGVTVPNGAETFVYNDGTNVIAAIDYLPSLALGTALPVASGGTGASTLTGVLKGNGTSAVTASNVNLATEVTGTLPVANGGTGAASLTANNVLLGNGTSALQVVAPGTAGNILTSDGTTWTSAALVGGPLTNNTRQAVTSTATTTIDIASGNVVDLTMAESITTLAFSNVPASGTPVQLVIIFRNAADGTAYNVTWPSSIYWDATTADGSLVGPTLAAGANSLTIISLLTTDGGTKWRGWTEAAIPGQLTGPALYSWGSNSQGRAGAGSAASISVPTQIGTLVNWSTVFSGSTSAFSIKTDGTLWAWGYNKFGQLGTGNVTTVNSPVQVGALTDWASVAVGRYFAVAVKTNNTLWSWGNNGFGQLGSNNVTYRSSPAQVGALTDWSKVTASNNAAFAIKTTGTLWSWGSNSVGQLGSNSIALRSSPAQVGALTDWAQVSSCAQGYHVLAVKTGGTLWSWGINNDGCLGLNASTSTLPFRSSPSQIGAVNTWANVSVGENFSIAIRTAGSIWSWGRNTAGQLGLSDLVNRSSPVQIGALTDWSIISAGGSFCHAIKSNNSLWGWGAGSSFQIGNGLTSNVISPVQIGSATSWQKVSNGSNFSIAVFDQPAINPA